MEIIVCSINEKKLVSRGFLIGPICTIYGFGVIFMILSLSRYTESLFILFGMSLFICSVLEYITSFIMEKLFNTRWWDYSNRKFNINGRVCLENSIWFGILGIIVLRYVNPFFVGIINMIPVLLLNILFWAFLVLLILDFVISYTTIYGFTKTAKLIKKDSSDEINKLVKEKIAKEKSILKKRLVEAFPNFNILIKLKK